MAEHGSPKSRRAQGQDRIREVLAALGGSVEEFDRMQEPSSEELALRINAYTDSQSPSRAASPAQTPEKADPTAERISGSIGPSRAHSAPRVSPPADRLRATTVPQVRRGGVALLRVAVFVLSVLARGVLAVARTLPGVARSLVHATPDVAHRVAHTTRVLCAATLRAGHAALALLASLPRATRKAVQLGLTPFSRPTAGIPVLAVAVAVVAGLTLTGTFGHDGGGSHAQERQVTRTALPSARLPPALNQPVPVLARDTFANPREYAAALTRLALMSRGTELDGAPACTARSTWDRWMCRTSGKPSVGAYAGQWFTYRCSPSPTTQRRQARASLVINCRSLSRRV
jgi:hypothetical protein